MRIILVILDKNNGPRNMTSIQKIEKKHQKVGGCLYKSTMSGIYQ